MGSQDGGDAAANDNKGKDRAEAKAFGEGDLDWMSEGAVEEKIGAKQAAGKAKK